MPGVQVLLVEDSVTDGELCVRALRSGGEASRGGPIISLII